MQKRRDLFQYIRSKKYNIACLEDVHIDIICFHIKAEWGYNLVLGAKPGINASGGGGGGGGCWGGGGGGVVMI